MNHVRGSARVPSFMEAADFYDATFDDYPSDQERLNLEWLVAKNLSSERVLLWQELGSPIPYIEYEPLKLPGLHRDFAALECTGEAVTGFANQYGFLGEDTRELHRVGTDNNEIGEYLYRWYEEIRGASLLLKLWDMYRDPATTDEELSGLVWLDSGVVGFQGDSMMNHKGGSVSGWLFDDVHIPRLRDGERAESFVRWCSRLLLEGLLSVAVGALTLPTFSARPGGQISLVPRNLLGAIYVLFVQEVLGRADPLTRCSGCGRWFVARHASRVYCSDACKMKAYRKGLKGK